MKNYRLYINGEFVSPQSNLTIDVIDPSTTGVVARVPNAGAADVDRAAQAARAAFDEGPWRDATAQDRGRVLFRLAEIVRDRADELAELETRNSGKPIVESEFDIADVATCSRTRWISRTSKSSRRRTSTGGTSRRRAPTTRSANASAGDASSHEGAKIAKITRRSVL